MIRGIGRWLSWATLCAFTACVGDGNGGGSGGGSGGAAGAGPPGGGEACALTGIAAGYAHTGGAMSFALDGVAYRACGTTALVNDDGAEGLVMIQGFGVDDAGDTWGAQITVVHQPGSSTPLSCGPDVVCAVQFFPRYGAEAVNCGPVATTDPDEQLGAAAVTIDALSDDRVSGTFSATLVDSGCGAVGQTLTAGTFDVVSITNPQRLGGVGGND